MYMRYREVVEKQGAGNAAPKRIIFYRGIVHRSLSIEYLWSLVPSDGVSEGQFKQVLEQG